MSKVRHFTGTQYAEAVVATTEKNYQQFIRHIRNRDKSTQSPQEFDHDIQEVRNEMKRLQQAMVRLHAEQTKDKHKQKVSDAYNYVGGRLHDSRCIFKALKSLRDDNDHPALWLPKNASLINLKMAKNAEETALDLAAKNFIRIHLIKPAEKHNAEMLKIANNYISGKKKELTKLYDAIAKQQNKIAELTQKQLKAKPAKQVEISDEIKNRQAEMQGAIKHYNQYLHKHLQEARSVCINSAESGTTVNPRQSVRLQLKRALKQRDELYAMNQFVVTQLPGYTTSNPNNGLIQAINKSNEKTPYVGLPISASDSGDEQRYAFKPATSVNDDYAIPEMDDAPIIAAPKYKWVAPMAVAVNRVLPDLYDVPEDSSSEHRYSNSGSNDAKPKY